MTRLKTQRTSEALGRVMDDSLDRQVCLHLVGRIGEVRAVSALDDQAWHWDQERDGLEVLLVSTS